MPREAEARSAKAAAIKALGTLLRYRGRIEREHRAAMQALETLRQRRLARAAPGPNEPEPALSAAASPPVAVANAADPNSAVADVTYAATATLRSDPDRVPALNRHQRRALAAMNRSRAA